MMTPIYVVVEKDMEKMSVTYLSSHTWGSDWKTQPKPFNGSQTKYCVVWTIVQPQRTSASSEKHFRKIERLRRTTQSNRYIFDLNRVDFTSWQDESHAKFPRPTTAETLRCYLNFYKDYPESVKRFELRLHRYSWTKQRRQATSLDAWHWKSLHRHLDPSLLWEKRISIYMSRNVRNNTATLVSIKFEAHQSERERELRTFMENQNMYIFPFHVINSWRFLFCWNVSCVLLGDDFGIQSYLMVELLTLANFLVQFQHKQLLFVFSIYLNNEPRTFSNIQVPP